MENQTSAVQALNILIVDDEANIRKTLSIALELAGHTVVAVSNGKDGLFQAGLRPVDLVFLDLRLGLEKGTDYIAEFIANSPWIKIVIITAYATVETAIEAMKFGAMDYLPKPFTPDQVQAIALRVAESKATETRVASLGGSQERGGSEVELGSQSPNMQRALTMARQVAASDTNVLLSGESGTGKSILARFIHSWSPRSRGPFGVVSCPSLSSELLESELFGHVQGAFTGAVRDYSGRIAACEGGTLFLDEIGDLPLKVQPKLLRFLQDREYERIGESATLKANIRVIAATNLDLEALVQSGKFREDLLYRLNVFQIEMPSLRQRQEDIAILANRFLATFSRKASRQFSGFSKDALSALRAYPWPGNIRELQNKIERAVIVSRGTEVGALELGLKPGNDLGLPSIGGHITLDKLEESHIRSVLASEKTLEDAARVLGIDPATLWRRRKKYSL